MSRKLPPGLLGRLSADQRGAWERTGALLSALGHDVVPRDPAYRMAQIEFVQTWLRGIYEESLQFPDRTTLERSTRQMAALGRYLVPPRRREAILAGRARTTARISALWDECDVLLMPTLAKTAIAAEGGYGKPAPVAIDIAGRFTPFTPIFNITGQPAISIPAGVGTDGLPLACSLSAGSAPRTCCTRSPARSRRPPRGPSVRPPGVMTRDHPPVAGHRRACRWRSLAAAGHGVGQDGVAVPPGPAPRPVHAEPVDTTVFSPTLHKLRVIHPKRDTQADDRLLLRLPDGLATRRRRSPTSTSIPRSARSPSIRRPGTPSTAGSSRRCTGR